jgi:hypothetical protein
MGLTIDEQETVINYGRGTDKISVYTTDTLMMRKLDRYAKDNPDWDLVKAETSNGEVVSKTYLVPKKYLLLRKRLPAIHEYTEDEKNVLRERLKQMREKEQQERENARPN